MTLGSEGQPFDVLDAYNLELLREDDVLCTYRGVHCSGNAAIQLVSAASESVAREAAQLLNNEFALRGRLDASWARKPSASGWRAARMVLIYPDDRGETLETACRHGVELTDFFELAVDIAAALGAAHAAGIIHRAISPATFLRERDSACRLIGFGYAATAAAVDHGAFLDVRHQAYMSPEHTGRTGLPVEARSDLYSLGIVLFQLLTGRLPFFVGHATSTSGWVHTHLASEPALAHELVPSVPPMVSAIVDKLLAKDPGDRYQSALGLAADLRRCRQAWKANAAIEDFTLAQDERAAALVFPSSLYEREEAIGELLGAYEHVQVEGTFGVSVIHGPSGIGKSALLAEFSASLSLADATVVHARADQYGGDVPYAAISSGLRRLVSHILAGDDASVAYWRERVTKELCDPALSLGLVPELKLLLDTPLSIPARAELESSRRVAAAVTGLLRAFARRERPLVLIVDNAQWLDSATRILLEQLIRAASDLPVMLLAATRSDAKLTDENLDGLGLRLSAQAGYFHETALKALSPAAVEKMLADLFGAPPSETNRLAALIHHKTAGIPYFVRQFIRSIVDDALAHHFSGKWEFSFEQIQARSLTDNLVDLALQRLTRLPRRLGRVLGALAGLGHPGNVALLSALTGVESRELAQLLAQALSAEVLTIDAAGYRFAHERLQEAAYGALDPAERMRFHHMYGSRLASQVEAGEHEDVLFRAVDHLAKAAPLIPEADAMRYAALAVSAGRQARRACAYASAVVYLEQARQFLSTSLRAEQAASLAFDLDFELARCHFLTGKLEACTTLLARLLTVPADRLTRGQVQALAVDLDVRRGRYSAAAGIALDALRPFGIDIPDEPTDAACDHAYAALRERLQGEQGKTLHTLPEATDPEVKATFTLLSSLLIAATFTSPRLQFIQLCHTLQLTLRHGIAPESTVSLAWLGVMVCERYAAFDDGFEYAQLARSLVIQRGYVAHQAQVLLPLDQLSVWTQPLAFSLDCAQAGFDLARAQDDHTMACFEACHRTCLFLARGDHLASVADEIANALSYVRQVGFSDIETILRTQQAFVDHLRLARSRHDEREALLKSVEPHAGRASEPMSTLRFWRWLYIGILDYLEGDFEHAFASLEEAGQLAWSAPAHIHQLDYHLFSVLVLCRRAAEGPDPTALRSRIAGHIGKIRAWAASNPLTFADKLALAEGAHYELEHDVAAALARYEQAAEHARAQGFDHIVGMAHERAALLSREQGHATAAQAHAAAACLAYRRWGALGKVACIEQSFPQITTASAPGLAMVETTAIRDIDTVIRSIRALSEEIHTTPLVQTLMTIALEHAGAQRGLLIRVKGGSALIEASARLTAQGVAVDTTHSTPGALDLPLTMLYTAMRMHVPVSVSDSQRPAPYARDPYLVSYPRCAAIIIPMIKHTELVGLLYLENRLSSYGFTGEHTQVLSLLAAQAAISLETASLYAELMEENRVRQRIEKALRESRATLLLGEQINQSGSWSWEVNRGVVTCSAEFRRIFNLDSKVTQFEFASLIQQVYPADRARVERALDEAVAGQRPVRLEHRIVGRDGLLRHLSVVGQPMGEGEADVYVGTVSDITRRKADEDSQRRVQAELARTARMTTVGELTAAIAHEVNQPLMAISASAGASLRWLHRDPPQIGQVETMLHEVVRQSARAGKIIQTLQTLAHRSPQFVDVDLHTLIRQLLAVARSDLDRNDIMADLNLTAVQSELEGDGIQLQQVFANLIANAVDAMTSLHGPERMLRITSSSVSEGQIEVAVEDNGIGVDEAILENMFAPFVSTKPDGMGMGLAICRSIVEAHGGQINAQRHYPRGCRVVFTLPVKPVSPALPYRERE